MKYAFIKAHKMVFRVRVMCRVLKVHHSGFYTWLKRPLSKRAIDDSRLTGLIKQAWLESGRVYGYRKLHDDLRSVGETCCPNRVARLASLAGVKAQIGYKRRLALMAVHLLSWQPTTCNRTSRWRCRIVLG